MGRKPARKNPAQRTIYCHDDALWRRIQARAETLGISTSQFLLKLAQQEVMRAPEGEVRSVVNL